MLTKIILSLIFSSAIAFAQSSSIHGNLIRIPFEASQINPADTMGSWISYSDSNGYINSDYINIVHTTQSILFEKSKEQDFTSLGLTTLLSLENFVNANSESCGWWMGYYDVPEPYIIYRTVPFRVENGYWLMNGVYNMSFLSDDDSITVLPRNYYGDMLYISGKINNKYLASFRKDSIGPAYDLYLLDLTNSPSFDTANAEKIYFDIPAAPYNIYQISSSLYIAGVDSLPYNGYGIYLFKFENDTFHFIKKVFNALDQSWIYRNGSLYIYEYPDLVKYEYNPSDTTFINRTAIVSDGGITTNDDFTFAVKHSGDSLFFYDVNNSQLVNTIDISGLDHPHGILIDSPYVYIHQTTYVTDIKEVPNRPLDYSLQVYPNPFNPVTNVVYTVPERGMVEIRMYDMLGREVRAIYRGEAEAGDHRITINGTDLSSGVYIIRFTAKNYSDTRKVLLLK